MCEQGFIKANSKNLPRINIFEVFEFMKNDERFKAPKTRGAAQACREIYGDAAIDYVQVKRTGDICTVKCRVCPTEQKCRNKSYSTTFVLNESTEEIIDIQCHDCAAAAGGCKHAITALMWAYRRGEEPAPTENACYWTKAQLSDAGVQKYITVKDLVPPKSSRLQKITLPDNSMFLNDVLQLSKSKQIDCQLSRQVDYLKCLEIEILSIHRLLLEFCNTNGGHSSKDFITFARIKMTKDLCDEAEKLTRNQSDSAQWHELRYGRITASKLYAIAHCKTVNGSLVKQITGESKFHGKTKEMLRGKELEKLVLLEVERKLNTQINNSGLFLLPNYPILGASPDGLTADYIVEIKCPSTNKTLTRYLSEDNINSTCKAQMQLQMLATGKKKGLFCVADPSFEKTKKIHMQWLEYDSQAAQELIDNSMQFWENNIYPLLLSSVQ